MSETFHSLKASGTEKEKKEKRDGKFRSDENFLYPFLQSHKNIIM